MESELVNTVSVLQLETNGAPHAHSTTAAAPGIRQRTSQDRTLLDKHWTFKAFYSRNRWIKYTPDTFDIVPLPVNRSFIGPSRRTDGFGMVKSCGIAGMN